MTIAASPTASPTPTNERNSALREIPLQTANVIMITTKTNAVPRSGWISTRKLAAPVTNTTGPIAYRIEVLDSWRLAMKYAP